MSIFVRIYILPWYMFIWLMPIMLIIYVFVDWCLRRFAGRYRKLWWLCCFGVWLVLILLETLHRSPGMETTYRFQTLFESYRQARSNPELYRANYMNVLLFFPGGMLLATLLEGRQRRAALVMALLVSLSFLIELVQMCFGLGLAEIDDVMHNVVGAFLGMAVVVGTSKIWSRKLSRL